MKFLIFLRGGQSVIECSIFIVIDKILDSGFHIISFDVAAAADLGAESFRSPKFFATSLRISGVQEKRAVVVRLLLLAKRRVMIQVYRSCLDDFGRLVRIVALHFKLTAHGVTACSTLIARLPLNFACRLTTNLQELAHLFCFQIYFYK